MPSLDSLRCGCLVFTAGEFLLEGIYTTIGRDSECTVCRSAKLLSRRHAAILFDGNDYLLIDLASANGSVVDGTPCTVHALHEGSSIKLGSLTFHFVHRRRALPAAPSWTASSNQRERLQCMSLRTSDMPTVRLHDPARRVGLDTKRLAADEMEEPSSSSDDQSLAALGAIARLLADDAIGPSDRPRHVLPLVHDVFHAQAAVLLTGDPAGSRLSVAAGTASLGEGEFSERFPRLYEFCQRAFVKKAALKGEWPDEHRLDPDLGPLLAIPLRYRDDCHGVLCVLRPTGTVNFEAAFHPTGAADLVEATAQLVGLAVCRPVT